MAVVPMKKLTLVGLGAEKKLILEALHYANCVELAETREIPGAERRRDEAELNGIIEQRARIENVIGIVEGKQAERGQAAKKDKADDYKPPKRPVFSCRRGVGFDEFMAAGNREYELMPVVSEVERRAARLTELRGERTHLENLAEQLKIYREVPLAFSEFALSRYAVTALGLIPETRYQAFCAGAEGFPRLYHERRGGNYNSVVVALAYLKEDAAEARRLLADVSFTECPFREPETAEEALKRVEDRLSGIGAEERETVRRITESGQFLEELKLLSDFLLLERHKTEASQGFACTASTFVLQAWIPAGCEQAVLDAVAAKTPAALAFAEEPAGDDEPPTLTRNPKLVAPYESVTNMFSVPRATERDPNLFVAMFFFLFFGIMVSDAGYGIVLTVATLLIMKLFKLESPMQKLVLVVCMGGVSTLIWGAVFGTWFGVDVIENNVPFFKSIAWFSPLQDPMKMLILCLALGLLQILFGMGVRAAELIKAGKIWDAVFDIFSWYVFFAGLFLLIFGMFLENAPKALTTAGLAVMGAGLAIVLLTAGRKKKGIFGKVLGGFGGLYNIVNFLSDVLSYSRLFGLGVATGVIGFTMNLLADLLFGILPPVGYIFGVVVLIGGHAFNIAINTLGAYIHNARLQYVEFFGKFYEGGGYEFQPLGWDTQYVSIRSDSGANSFASERDTHKKHAAKPAWNKG